MKQNKFLYGFIRFICRPLLVIFFPYKMNGVHNLNEIKDGCILCSNHTSNVDPIFLLVASNRGIYFMGKSELFKNKIIGWFFSQLGAFPVKRGKGDRRAISEAEQVVKQGNVLGIFIEGTRSKTGEFLKPRSGVAALSYITNSAIIPVCITGANNSKVKVFRKTIIEFGSPILSQELGITSGGHSEYRRASELIMKNIRNIREKEAYKGEKT